MDEPVTVTVEALTHRVEAIFKKAGLGPDHAQALARVIAAGERDGCRAHGIYRIEGCLRTVKAGKVRPDAKPTLQDDGSAVLRVAAGGGFSCAAFELGATANHVDPARARQLVEKTFGRITTASDTTSQAAS